MYVRPLSRFLQGGALAIASFAHKQRSKRKKEQDEAWNAPFGMYSTSHLKFYMFRGNVFIILPIEGLFLTF